tara:strand:- start:9805 stop:10056 length:252 start_codon:yes stop_codon:yes gene_type:complete
MCRLLCAPTLAPKIVPVLKQAVETGWISGLDLSAGFIEAMHEEALSTLRLVAASGSQVASPDPSDNVEDTVVDPSEIEGGPTG